MSEIFVVSAPSTLELREFREADLRPVVAIERTLFANPWPEGAFRRLLRDPHAISRVALVESTVTGYAFGWWLGEEAELGNLAVVPGQQRRSVGSTLLEWFLAACAARRVREVYLDVRESNDIARRLYERHGFRQFGRRRHYYSKPREDALIYRAVIDAGTAADTVPL